MQSTIDFTELAHVMGDAVIVSDAAGDITFWNAAAERIFGFTPDDALGQSLDIIIPEKQRPRHWQGYHETMRTGQTRYGADLLRVPALHKDGRLLSISFTVALLTGGDSAARAIVAVVRDETERWANERALKKRVSELEAQAV
ncbi:MAG: histidine kinase [Rhizobiales bacterium 32-66-8]|nr:MAG: histidine kinase [Rhizobiales bacterium 32-66-8]